MDATRQLFGQRGMDAPLALDAADALERNRHHADMKMGFADAAIGPRRAGVTGMAGAFIGDFKGGRREGPGQLLPDGFCYAHAGEGRFAAA